MALDAKAWAQSGDLFEFFEEEAQVVSASRRPQSLRQAPATVYVVKGEDIQRSGVYTLWDALRGVPGVDVMSNRSMYGAVSIRGLNKALNNRTLVLLDGKTVLDGDLNRINWEAVPVVLEDIDRIEVVEGPASAHYGANAINGVINIITKTPDQVQGLKVGFTTGELNTQLGSFLFANRQEKMSYKLSLGTRHANRFEDADASASKAAVLNGLLRYEMGENRWGSIALGGSRIDTDSGFGTLGRAYEVAQRGFLRADFVQGPSHFRFFWNGGEGDLEDVNPSLPLVDLDCDIYDLNFEHALTLPRENTLVLGGGLRRGEFHSEIISSGGNLQYLWDLFFENEWRATEKWTLWASGRLDRHPHTGLVYSPRLSIVFTPDDKNVLRLSHGTSFRNPTLIENHLKVEQIVPMVEGSAVVEILGKKDLHAECLSLQEVAHGLNVGNFQTKIAAFRYQLMQGVALSELTQVPIDSSNTKVQSSFINEDALVNAWGGEFGLEYTFGKNLSGFANYSYQRFSGKLDSQVAGHGTPHKYNSGLRFKGDNLDLTASFHWVDQTLWSDNRIVPGQVGQVKLTEVSSYALANLHIGYRFAGRLENLEVGLGIFNLLNEEHYEALPGQGDDGLGQGGRSSVPGAC